MVDNNFSIHTTGNPDNGKIEECPSDKFSKSLIHPAISSSSISLLFNSIIKELRDKFRAFPSLLEAAKLAQTTTSKYIKSSKQLMSSVRHVPQIKPELFNSLVMPSSHKTNEDDTKFKLQNILKQKVCLEQRLKELNVSMNAIQNTLTSSQQNSTRKVVCTKLLPNDLGHIKPIDFLIKNSNKRYKIINATKPMTGMPESNSNERPLDNSLNNLKKYSTNKSFIQKEYVHKLDDSMNRSPSMEKKEYLYKKLEEKYHRESLLPILEKRKIELAKKRNYFKPVTQEEIKEHQKKYDEFIQQRKAEKIAEINQRKIEDEIFSVRVQKFETEVSQKYFSMDQEEREKKEKQIVEQKLRREKMGNYANLLFWLLCQYKKCDY